MTTKKLTWNVWVLKSPPKTEIYVWIYPHAKFSKYTLSLDLHAEWIQKSQRTWVKPQKRWDFRCLVPGDWTSGEREGERGYCRPEVWWLCVYTDVSQTKTDLQREFLVPCLQRRWLHDLIKNNCGHLDGRGFGGRMDTCVCMAESLCCPPEPIIILLIGCTPIQNKKFFFPKKLLQYPWAFITNQ